jgi:hypothetical protein
MLLQVLRSYSAATFGVTKFILIISTNLVTLSAAA